LHEQCSGFFVAGGRFDTVMWQFASAFVYVFGLCTALHVRCVVV